LHLIAGKGIGSFVIKWVFKKWCQNVTRWYELISSGKQWTQLP